MTLPPDATAYLYALGTISTTFVGFSAIIMTFRQTAGGGLSPLDSWITAVFIQLGFIVTAGSLSVPLLELCGVPPVSTWRLCSGVYGLMLTLFAASYPHRRRAVSGVPTPLFVWFDLLLLAACIAALLGNAVGIPARSNPGSFAAGLTGTLFTAGVGYLHALGNLHKETKRVANPMDQKQTRSF